MKEKEKKKFTRGACPYAYFNIYYRNGKRLVEDRTDGLSWEKAEKRNILGVGLQFDPMPLFEFIRVPIAEDLLDKEIKFDKGFYIQHPLPIRNSDGSHVRFKPDEHMLKGSQKYEYQFFFYKTKIHKSNVKGEGTWKKVTLGMIVSPDGQCMVLEGYDGGRIRTYFTTLKSLGFVDQQSLDKQGIEGEVERVFDDKGKLIDVKYKLSVVGLIRDPLTTCHTCGTDWFIWKDHPEGDCVKLNLSEKND
jgi:hypothetical protein